MIARKIESQNFITSQSLAKRIVSLAGFDRSDYVLEIGAGSGVLTAEIADCCGRVTAIEIDPVLANLLSLKFADHPRVEVAAEDVLDFELPCEKFKVFSNVPFHITSDLMRKLLTTRDAPTETYLVLQKEAADKFSGLNGSTKASLLLFPYFEFKNVWQFKRSDFAPSPKVDTVLLKITKRAESLLQTKEERNYRQFVSYAFGKWKSNLKLALSDVFTYRQWCRLARENGFAIKAKASELSGEQWLAVYLFWRERRVTRIVGLRYSQLVGL